MKTLFLALTLICGSYYKLPKDANVPIIVIENKMNFSLKDVCFDGSKDYQNKKEAVIIIRHCKHVELTNILVCNGAVGLLIDSCEDVTIAGLNAYDNDYGVIIYNSHHITLIDSVVGSGALIDSHHNKILRIKGGFYLKNCHDDVLGDFKVLRAKE